MKKSLTLLVWLLCLLFVLTACAPAATTPSASSAAPAAVSSQAAPASSEAPAASTAAATTQVENTALKDFTYVQPAGTEVEVNTYYKANGVESNVGIRAKGGEVTVEDNQEAAMPKPNKKYKIGFSVYYTVDEVGSMYLEGMKAAAEEAGIELLVNDAQYDQNLQDEAIEQWILQKVDGVILTPCDFTAVKTSLDALEKAKIPVITLDAPPQAGNVDSMIIYDCIEQGRLAGDMLVQGLLAQGKEMKGTVVYNTLPFVHPNAITREIGFKKSFEKYPDIKFLVLTGESPEDHYTAFEGAIQANPDMLGAWGLYDSATIGMLNAMKAAHREDILLTSVDNDRTLIASISKGEIVGSVGYSAIAGSRWALNQMINLLNGAEIPGIIHQENVQITKYNAEERFAHYYNGKTLADYLAGKE